MSLFSDTSQSAMLFFDANCHILWFNNYQWLHVPHVTPNQFDNKQSKPNYCNLLPVGSWTPTFALFPSASCSLTHFFLSQLEKPNLLCCSRGHNSYRWLPLTVCLLVCVYSRAPLRWCRPHSRMRCPQGPGGHQVQIPLWWAAWCEPATGRRGQTPLTRRHLTPDPH